MNKRVGKQTVKLKNPPSICNVASIVGPKEGLGPLGSNFDLILEDELWGENTWEKAERKLIRETFSKILYSSGKSYEDIGYIVAGDLLNQCISASFGLRDVEIPFLGVYGACSTMVESMSIGAMLVDGGFADNVVALTSSHFCSAERQFRYPLELGAVRAPSSQWTVTGSGGVMLTNSDTGGPYITHITSGKIVDKGIKDSNNMGAAMAPAAADTMIRHFRDTGIEPESYDLIVTGDLGIIGSEICCELLMMNGYDISSRYNDCGVMIFDIENQGCNAGGSGCGCCAVTFSGYLYKEIQKGNINNLLLVATGALLSPVTVQQGESIPSIAHAITIQKML